VRQIEALAGRRVKQIACGANHSMFLMDGGAVYTCGSNDLGQLGHGTKDVFEMIPLRIETNHIIQESGDRFSYIAAGPQHSVAVATNGNVFGWGDVAEGQLGSNCGDRVRVQFHTNAERRWCEQKATMIDCFGAAKGIRITKVECGGDWPTPSKGAGHTIFVDSNRQCYSIGLNQHGQLGRQTDESDDAWEDQRCAAPVGGVNDVKQVSCGGNHTAYLLNDGTLMTSGEIDHGQLGELLIPLLVSMPALSR